MRSALLLICVVSVAGDLYGQNPRCSNNRLNEKSANRNNGNRLFDSQNNNRGGYNAGDVATDAFNSNTGNAPGSLFGRELNQGQYSMVYYSGSVLPIEWTQQHGCGGNEKGDPHKLNCNMVLQFMCNTNNDVQKDYAMQVELKNGRNTNAPDTAGNWQEVTNGNKKEQNDNAGRGRHESEGWYYECERRQRNKGLFTADQNLKGKNTMKNTRQNPNGNRRGLECPQERDYLNLIPSPWIDIAMLSDSKRQCDEYKANSMNTGVIGKCVHTGANNNNPAAWQKLTKQECEETDDSEWKEFTHDSYAPKCFQADWSRVNHLGNGLDGQHISYDWEVPALTTKGVGQYTDIKGDGNKVAKCVLRMRYNISTDDYDPFNTTAEHNEDKQAGVVSPVEQNPTVDVGANLQGLKLAINTAQFGRTFQDRSHVFYIKDRPDIPNAQNQKFYNLNVRGKRGNIVQTYPSVEYDFVPNSLEIQTGQVIHMQWTGSNTHNNGNPAGDGQAGDAGEGTGGTDRHNVAPILDLKQNWPIPLDSPDPEMQKKNLYKHFDCYAFNQEVSNTLVWYQRSEVAKLSENDCACHLLSSGKFKDCQEAASDNINPLLNDAPASLMNGVFLVPRTEGSFHYMCTRNNNFSNRSQKATIKVVAKKAAATPRKEPV